MADRYVAPPAGSFGGALPQPVQCIVVHSLEAPATPGIAYSLATGWLQHEKVSIHAITDPVESVDMVGLSTVAYHCGGGNRRSVGDEVTGYAAWTTAQWEDPKAFAALRLDAKKVAQQAQKLGIPLRWLKVAEIKAGVRGIITHNDARLAWGGTTHTDPGPGFPYDVFMKMCQQWAGDAVNPGPAPTPTPGPQTGGAEPVTPDEDEENMIRMVKLGGADTIWVVDFGQRTKWGIPNPEVYSWLANMGVKAIGGDQPPQFLEGFRDISGN